MSASDSPIRIGYVLARRDVELPWLPGRRYRGIDRLPFVPGSLEDSGDRAVEIWKRYLDAWEDGGISQNLDLAREVEHQFYELGDHVEIVYAEAIVVPSAESLNQTDKVMLQRELSLAWLRSRSVGIKSPPAEFAPLGLDISSPIPSFHSAIVQPGLVRQDLDLADRLNEVGLVPDLQFAIELMGEANATGYGLGMFSVIRILGDQHGQ